MTLIITDENGCKDTATQNVTVKQRPIIDFYDARDWKHCAYGAIAADTLTFENDFTYYDLGDGELFFGGSYNVNCK